MDLPFLKKKKEKKDFFLAIIFKFHSVSSILFEEERGKLSILASNKEKIPSNLEDLSEEEILQVCDASISAVEQNLPEEVFVNKTIFGVPYGWVEDSKIKKEYLAKLKKVCDELELVPVGFIVSIEAVIFYLQNKEGAPISAIFIEIEKNHLFLYMVRAGKVLEVKSAESDNNFPEAVEAMLGSLQTTGALPSKIILLASTGTEDKQQEFLSFPWMRELPFLHLPKVMIFEKDWENDAIIRGVATQMGFELLEEPHREIPEKETKDMDLQENRDEKIVIENYKRLEEKQEENYENFGFLTDEDISDVKEEAENISQNTGLDKFEKHAAKDKKSRGKNIMDFLKVPDFLSIKKKLFSKATSIREKIPKHEQSQRLAFVSKAKFLLIPVFLVLFCVSFVWFYYHNLLKAEIILFIDKKEISKDLKIVLSSDSQTSVKNSVLKINYITVEEKGELDKKTSGKKETGDKAAGEITLYNKTEQDKTFSKGTVLVSSNNLQYELQDDTKIASTSAFSTNFTSTKLKVTAKTFGTEYNLPSDINFTVKDYPTSSFFGKNATAFSGGTKKEISVVSKNDLQGLSDDLLKNLEDKALNSDLKSKLNSDEKLLPFIVSYKISSQVFDKKEGEEAAKVSLNAVIEFTGANYSNMEIDNLSKELEKEEIPSDYYIDHAKSSIELKNPEIKKDKTITANLSIRYIYVPKIDENGLVSQAVNLNSGDYEAKLKKIKGVSDEKIIFTNQLSLFPSNMPANVNNIKLTTKLNE